MLQGFQWHCPADCTLWRTIHGQADALAGLGFTSVWLPPASKATGGVDDVGDGVYDLWDLGEFDQKGTVPTKYGTRQELSDTVRALQAAGLSVYADVVLNHRLGADHKHQVTGRRVDLNDRTRLSEEVITASAWCGYGFPGRRGKYSQLQWGAEHFTAVDAEFNEGDHGVLLLDGKSFSDQVSNENGNDDYLLGCDVDGNHPSVREDLFAWGVWLVETLGVDGFRLDAVKHMPASFFHDWLEHVRSNFDGRELFVVAEYWHNDPEALMGYFDAIDHDMSLFDVSLHYRFVEASKLGREFDLRTIYDGSLVQRHPIRAVTFVDNHDTEPGQSLESWVDDWFKPMAYAVILLRREGYPCVFQGDLLGLCNDPRGAIHRTTIEQLLMLRRTLSNGEQIEAFDGPNCIGWGRLCPDGTNAAVVALNNAEECTLNFTLPGGPRTYRNLLDDTLSPVTTGEDGAGTFPCQAGARSVWVALA